jgi:hypothetical protein
MVLADAREIDHLRRPITEPDSRPDEVGRRGQRRRVVRAEEVAPARDPQVGPVGDLADAAHRRLDLQLVRLGRLEVLQPATELDRLAVGDERVGDRGQRGIAQGHVRHDRAA